MIRRPVLAAAVLSAALLPLAALKPAVAAKPKVTFTRQLVSPKSVKVGASVTARFRVNLIGGATAGDATLLVGALSVPMTRTGNDYTATFNAPAVNSTGNKPVTVPVTAQITVNPGGTKTVKLGNLKITPAPIDSNGPPPPPPI